MKALQILLAGALLLPGMASARCWQPDVDASRLAYVAAQGEGRFEGVFRDFEGTVCLDPAQPEDGHIILKVRTGSVDSGIPELDAALGNDLFFASARWPHAVFESTDIRLLAPGKFETEGHFTLRGITHPVTVPFSFTASGAGAALEGATAIRRLDYDVGLGDWRDTQFLDNEVKLRFEVKLVPAPGP